VVDVIVTIVLLDAVGIVLFVLLALNAPELPWHE
jgi:hypothetical protein